MTGENEISWAQKALPMAREFVQLLEMGEAAEAQKMLEQMRGDRDASLFSEIGKLTRQLHEALVNFHLEDRVTDIAATDIPDARDRLNYVITMTEAAANKTMDGLEKCLPTVTQLGQHAGELNSRLAKLLRKEMSPAEFRELYKELMAYMTTTETQMLEVQSSLNEVMLAQDYQDLTGQIIRRVINLVQEVEHSLVDMIKMFGAMNEYSAAKERGVKPIDGVEGPVVNAEKRDDVVHGQDDVDDLLSSLGF